MVQVKIMVSKNVLIAAVAALVIVASVGLILTIETEAKEPKIVILAQVNSEGSAIFVKNDIDSVEDMKGKVFATPGEASIQHMILMNFVKDAGIKWAIAPGSGQSKASDTVYWTEIAPANMKGAFKEQLIQGGIAWEPFNSDIVLDPTVTEAKILVWSDELIPAHPCCVVAANAKFVENNPETIEKFLAAHVLATQWIVDTLADDTSANYTLMIDMGAKFAERPAAVVEESLKHVTFNSSIEQDWKDSLEMIVDTYISLKMIGSMSSIGFDNSTSFVDAIVNETYLQNSASVVIADPADDLVDVRVGWLRGDVHQMARLVAMNETVGQGFGFGDRTIFEAYGLNIVPGAGNEYANGGAVYTAFEADLIDIGMLGAPPAILRTANSLA